MGLFALEHSPAAYLADFVLNGATVVVLSTTLLVAGPPEQRLQAAAIVAAGLTGWTVIEYLLHRYVLHGMQPFRRWHAQHHQRPAALIYTPTILVAALIATLVFLPALLLGNLWLACALTLGVQSGSLAYASVHHAVHHWRGDSSWLKQRKHLHALHHRRGAALGCYGVTSAFWDHVFGSAPSPAALLHR